SQAGPAPGVQASDQAGPRYRGREAWRRCGARNVEQYSQAVWIEAMKYLIVIEQTATGYSAYSPDLPGCISTGSTRDDVESEMKDAIAFHLDGLGAGGMAIQKPTTSSP